MRLEEIVLSDLTYDLLYTSGQLARRNGAGRDDGWKALAKDLGFNSNERTPAREAYEDGFYAAPQA